jgi:hypothetical protein
MEDSTLILLGAAGVAAYFWWQNSQATVVPASVPSEAVMCTAANPCNASVVPTSAVTPAATTCLTPSSSDPRWPPLVNGVRQEFEDACGNFWFKNNPGTTSETIGSYGLLPA